MLFSLTKAVISVIQFCSLPVLITFLLSYTGESYSQQTDVLSSVWSEGLLCLEILSQWQVSTRPVWVGRGGRGGCYYATLKKSTKYLPPSLQKLESSFTFCIACGNKKTARQAAVSVCYTCQFLVQLASQQNCQTSCMKNCLV